MNVSEFARLTGVSVRTLHYYDEIDLLKPDFVEKNGYRYYGENALERIREILFYRELDFSLKTINKIISSPKYNKEEALKEQKQLLLLKRQRLDKIIELLNSAEKGEKIMDFNAFDKEGINSYKDEVKQRWGETQAYKEYEEKTAGYTQENKNAVAKSLNEIMEEFAKIKDSGEKADSEKTLKQVKRLQDYITQTQYTCTKDILNFLGSMYVNDERFKKNIDKYSQGNAEYINQAIKNYCKE